LVCLCRNTQYSELSLFEVFMATISAAGIGSGLDVQGILEQIVEAERLPTENRLNANEAILQAELSAFGLLTSSVNTFQSSLGKLNTAASFSSTDVGVSNTDVLSATSTSIAKDGNFTVEVKQLAQSHTLASIAFDNIDDVIGSGTLNFSFGTTVYDPGTDFNTADDSYTSFTRNDERSNESVVIDNSNNTVAGVRDAINNANIGVSASIVDDGSGFRLLISADQRGVDNSIELTVEEDGVVNNDTDGLSVLAFNGSATNVEQTQVAQDAELTINGLTVKRDSNIVSGAIPGVTMTLKTADVGNPLLVSVTNQNVSQAEENISSFVSSFNEMASVFNALTQFGGNDGENGILLGDTTARNIMQQTRRELGGVIENGGSFNSLSSIGITTSRDGTLSLDSNVLNKALKDDFDSVAQLFYANGNASDSEVLFSSSNGRTQEGDYAVSISTLATQGTLTGEAVAGAVTINASNNNFSLEVDGTSSGSISITQATYNNLSDLAQEIENRINADSALQSAGKNVSVAYVDGAFAITSDSYGTDSKVSVSTQNNSLGFNTNSTSITGSDVVGSIGGLSAIGSGRFLTGSGAASGLVLEITGNDTGSRGSVNFSQGLAAKLDSLLLEFQADNGQLTAKTDSINARIETISQDRADLLARVADVEERYRREFSALDVLIAQLNTTSDFLQQQLDSLPGVTFNQN